MADMVKAFDLEEGDEIMIKYDGEIERAEVRYIEKKLFSGQMVVEMLNPTWTRLVDFDERTEYERAL